jgi:hypothetical protein
MPRYLYIWAKHTVESSVPDPHPDPEDPYVFGPPGSGPGSASEMYGSVSFDHQAKILKIVRKTLIPTVSRLLFDFFSTKRENKLFSCRPSTCTSRYNVQNIR